MNDTLTTPPKQTRSTPLLQTQNEISQPPHPTNCTPTHVQIQLIVRCFIYNLKMANIDGRNMQLYRSNNKRTIRNIVVFFTIYICSNNLFLLFDNTTGMTHLKIICVYLCFYVKFRIKTYHILIHHSLLLISLLSITTDTHLRLI